MKRFYMAIVLTVAFYSTVSAQEEMILRDPWAFETAFEMYSVRDTLPFDKKASEMMKNISVNLSKGICFENEKNWKLLTGLEPYRKAKQVQDSIKQWCKSYHRSPACTTTDVSRLATSYRNKNFKTVMANARKMLDRPSLRRASSNETEMYKEFGVRNNFALALMHENYDLCAQVELEIILFNRTSFLPSGSLDARFDIKEFKSTFLPAMINLTVVYERLGRTDDAELLAGKLRDYAQQNDCENFLINFNAAWYHFKSMEKNSNFSDRNKKEGYKYLEKLDGVKVEKYRIFDDVYSLLLKGNEKPSYHDNFGKRPVFHPSVLIYLGISAFLWLIVMIVLQYVKRIYGAFLIIYMLVTAYILLWMPFYSIAKEIFITALAIPFILAVPFWLFRKKKS